MVVVLRILVSSMFGCFLVMVDDFIDDYCCFIMLLVVFVDSSCVEIDMFLWFSVRICV